MFGTEEQLEKWCKMFDAQYVHLYWREVGTTEHFGNMSISRRQNTGATIVTGKCGFK